MNVPYMTKMTKKILIIEDDVTLARIYAIKLAHEFDVQTVHTEQDAWELLQKSTYNLIILDGTGHIDQTHAFVKELESHNTFKSIPILIISNREIEQIEKLSEYNNVVDTLLKVTLDINKLPNKIHEHIL